ncbi:hypothetical protein BDQ17DRAFT_1431120 [Cyathus striatus]|nr:hypothetical protein BDQ17DRAFT_1431120 [Cyathus striatus]
MQVDPRRQRQDTFDLREQVLHDDNLQMQAHADAAANGGYHNDTDEEHSVLEDDSDGEDREEYMDDEDDRSSSLSIPNESIDFDLVYSLHSFAATVEGQANVVKGDSLFLMDDSNSYWWLVRVLKTQEVGYIPAENIETPFERLARLNKHRNVDLASATQAELQEGLNASQDRFRQNLSSRNGSGSHSNSPSPSQRKKSGKGVLFTPALRYHRYPPAVWNEDEEEDDDDEWDEREYNEHDMELARELEEEHRVLMMEAAKERGAAQQAQVQAQAQQVQIQQQQQLLLQQTQQSMPGGMSMEMDDDDGIQWDDKAAEEMQKQIIARQQARVLELQQQGQGQGQEGVPEALQPAAGREQQQQQMLRMQQQQQMEAQMQAKLAQQQQQQQQQAQQQQPQQQQDPPASLRPSASRERLVSPAPAQEVKSVSPAPGQKRIDPAEVTETRKLTATPIIAQDQEGYNQTLEQQRKEREKRDREREMEEEEARKRARASTGSPGGSLGGRGTPVVVAAQQQQQQRGGKLRKDPAGRERGAESEDEGGKKKKSGGVFGSLFRRKDRDSKEKEKGRGAEKVGAGAAMSMGSVESGGTGDAYSRQSEESGRSARPSVGSTEMGALSPTTSQALQAQQQQAASAIRSPPPPVAAQLAPVTPERPSMSSSISSSPSVSQLRQRDQQQQLLYQQYLNRSPSGAPEASYGLQSASAVLGHLHGSPLATSSSANGGLGPPTPRQRPGSLIISPGDGQNPAVPELSVIRVFAGKQLQTEATFKTVLLNSSTTAHDLVKQAIQRFRLPAGEDESDYYLTVKQVEGGGSAVLRPQEKPLLVFETLVNDAQMEMMMPKVKRSSVGSISSVASNLSMHPAIRKLPMNDFSDDSAVKFYLNRRGDEGDESGEHDEEGDDTLIAEQSFGGESAEANNVHSPTRTYLSVNTQANVTPERFTSPSIRFPLQLVIYPNDLPDDMAFHPLTEAIVFKHTLRDADVAGSGGVSMSWRRKVFMFPKNVTVAEVIELGLERFGILEGVVDGGDEVEDKMTKRRSSTRVRYELCVEVPGQPEKELAPSSKVIDAFPRPPSFRATDRNSGSMKRRSVDSTQLLGTLEDVHVDDPMFILRRATSYRNTTSRHRMSAPLDEIALQRIQNSNRESASSVYSSDQPQQQDDGNRLKQPSRQEIIAAQRAVSRANQRAILSAQTNSVSGMDVLLPGNAILRSSRYDASDKMRYSYVEPDGESYDISDIVEEEWRDQGREKNMNRDDLLEGVVRRGGGDKIDRVLNKIREREKGRGEGESMSVNSARLSQRSASGSEYSDEGPALSGEELAAPSVVPSTARSTPVVAVRSTSPQQESRSGASTPTQKPAYAPPTNRRHPSLASVVSDMSGYETPPTHAPSPANGLQESPRRMRESPQRMHDSSPQESPQPQRTRDSPHTHRSNTSSSIARARKLIIPGDDFGVDSMMAIIECRAHQAKPQQNAMKRKETEVERDVVEERLFGPVVDLEALHPGIREIYRDGFRFLENVDKFLDRLMPSSAAVSAGSA